jgi:nucleotide-binding universal stress UspA family protein
VTGAAGDIAELFGASVIGIAACHPTPVAYPDGWYDAEEQDRSYSEDDIKATEAEFRSALHGRAKTISWRSNVVTEPLADYIAGEARCADIVVTAASAASPSDLTRRVNPSDLLMVMGRPVLLVPPDELRLKLDRAVVGWNDSQEARRALADALPLLQKASYVAVATIVPAEEVRAARLKVDDVVGWLKQHGVKAVAVVARSNGEDAAQLQGIVRDHDAGIVIAGAYGQSRLREWALGGVTRHLLLHGRGCALLSH